jgi:hypothetical protein
MILLAILIAFGAGFNTGVVKTKKDLSSPDAYFCTVDHLGTKRCFSSVQDPYATDVNYLPKRTN